MLFIITNKKKEKFEIELHKNGGEDIFENFELNVPDECEEENGYYLIAHRDLQNIIDYWKDEVDSFNNEGVSMEFGTQEGNEEYTLVLNGKEFKGY